LERKHIKQHDPTGNTSIQFNLIQFREKTTTELSSQLSTNQNHKNTKLKQSFLQNEIPKYLNMSFVYLCL